MHGLTELHIYLAIHRNRQFPTCSWQSKGHVGKTGRFFKHSKEVNFPRNNKCLILSWLNHQTMVAGTSARGSNEPCMLNTSISKENGLCNTQSSLLPDSNGLDSLVASDTVFTLWRSEKHLLETVMLPTELSWLVLFAWNQTPIIFRLKGR